MAGPCFLLHQNSIPQKTRSQRTGNPKNREKTNSFSMFRIGEPFLKRNPPSQEHSPTSVWTNYTLHVFFGFVDLKFKVVVAHRPHLVAAFAHKFGFQKMVESVAYECSSRSAQPSTWMIIPVSKLLIAMLRFRPLRIRSFPFPNGHQHGL